ncbi:MAG: peptidyl-prolyl cis-trans isomerase [Desulfuromonas sp.]|nr:peptidyl-prolyl cis-trans isomerase [Desulfuromonas sp.]
MRKSILTLLLLAVISLSPALAAETVVMETSLGSITLELDNVKAPASVANFLAYADAGFYDGTIFHRVIPNFMIQGGGYTVDLKQKPTQPPVKNEAANGLKNLRGTIAMARTRVVDSATSQFFINHKDNPALDHRAPTPDAFGYAVFGKVVKGLEVVDKIAAVQTRPVNALFQDMPVETVVIKSVRRVK